MVSLVKLSSNNMEEFQRLCKKNFSKETYDKDFFEYYDAQTFIPKFFSKRLVKLFKYDERVIGYMWHEIPVDRYIKIFSLYIDDNYLDIVNKKTIKKFDEKQLVYESIDDEEKTEMLKNLGFNSSKPSKLMKLSINSYMREYDTKVQENKVLSNKKVIYLINNLFNTDYKNIEISFSKVDINNELQLRCEIQNNIFNSNSRIPIELEDIENDINEEYYINNLAIFIRINDLTVGYGQVIYNRQMFTLVNFGIIEELRSYGLGKILLNYIILECKKNNIVELNLRVEENNINAIRLYNWIGFKYHCNILRWER